MPINAERAKQYLKKGDLPTLFREELGWDKCKTIITIPAGDEHYELKAIAIKGGFVAFQCQASNGNGIPQYSTRRKLEKELAKSAREHIIVYLDHDGSNQIWQWVKREPEKPIACREYHYHRTQSGEALTQKLETLLVSLEEEEAGITILDIAGRVRSAFDVDRITKRFYERFKQEHTAFLKFIKGIPVKPDSEWYASIMLNRLMFIYFIQKKGFLDNDRDYLRNRLTMVQQHKGDGKFHSFYRHFLLRLFHEGLGKRESERPHELDELLGKVPYLNGGLFDYHQLEKTYPELDIPDKAFEKLFDFFDDYQWHLDDRPLREGNEINPDVLGYIFEKYINQKQMGAYYTKEDITEYISRNTVVPRLLDMARKQCKIAFEGDPSVWNLLQANPDLYIFGAVAHGTSLPLPPKIEKGIHDVLKRGEWNKPAPITHALPTEIWREVVARRQRHQEVRSKLADGKVQEINDLITLNLDIRQFAQDVIESCEGPDLLRAFWKSLTGITILDPTCGSGAFLFAALNILEPLYQAALDRMQAFVHDLDRSGVKASPKKYEDFRSTLADLHSHPNERYFILKNIILNNLYGVDIMDEAIEICKLRLFLKLVAQLDDVEHIEPLPDIDFNIRAGNTLVGFASMESLKRAVENDMLKQMALPSIEEKAKDVERLFLHFRHQQTRLGGVVTPDDKQNLRHRLDTLEDELNIYLATEYGINVQKRKELDAWRSTHKPFHWLVEFYGIMSNGGFDCIIGNPPWKEKSTLKGQYVLSHYETETCGNLYAMCIERCLQIRANTGHLSFIVQLPLISSSRMLKVRQLLKKNSHVLHLHPF